MNVFSTTVLIIDLGRKIGVFSGCQEPYRCSLADLLGNLEDMEAMLRTIVKKTVCRRNSPIKNDEIEALLPQDHFCTISALGPADLTIR